MTNKCYVVPVQKTCNCNCSFCISKVRDYHKKQEFLLLDSLFYQQIYQLKNQGIRHFEITGGGEPTIHPQLQEIIFSIKSIIPDSFIKLYTNGYQIDNLLGIDELDISVVSYDQNKNDAIMRPNVSMDVVSRLHDIRVRYPSISMRLSIPLIAGGIDNARELQEFISLTPFIDSYVVRTLYPKTQNRDSSFVDFPFNHPKVVMEKENDVQEFDGIILWSDGQIYRNWQLTTTRNIVPSYLLLKPDSQTYFSSIVDSIYQKGFSISDMYMMDSFVEQALMLYEDKKNETDYYSIVKRHLENLAYLFGNNGVVVLLSSDCSYSKLVKDTYDLKTYLRKLYSFTHLHGGYLQVGDNLSHLNLVHAPDGVTEYYLRDLAVMQKSGMLSPSQKVDEETFQKIKRFSSYHGVL